MSVLDLGGCEAPHSCLFLSNSWLQHSATMQPVRSRGISVKGKKERKKIQSFSLSALLLQEMQSREMWSLRISPNSEMRIYREGKNQLQDTMHWEIQIQLTPDTPGFKLSFGSRDYRWCCLKAADTPSGLFHGHSRGGVGCCQWAIKFLYQMTLLIVTPSTQMSKFVVLYWW